MLSDVQRKFLVESTSQYVSSMDGSPAAEYLESRGLAIGNPEVAKFRLGYVDDPLPGHDMYRGMLAIPYLRRAPSGEWSVVSMRFRCVTQGCEHSNHGKYMSSPGDSPMIFNTLAILKNEDSIAICEGEIDAITASISGVPAVGIPGVESWQDYYRVLFLGYEVVYILADGDDAGMKFAHKLAKALPNAKILPSPQGEDVNSTVMKYGATALTERIQK